MASRALKLSSVYATAELACAPLRAGSTVAYCYRVIRELSAGGMSQLYLVEHLPSGSYAALKVAARTSCQVLPREYALLQRAAHPNVVKAFEHGRLHDERRYLVLQLVPGADLAAWLSTYRQLRPAQTMSVLFQLSAAVDHLHELGIVHSDIKPSNVMLNVHDQRVTLIDFGVAFDFDRERAQRGSSGTRGYMAPEQVRGRGCGPASDRYAVAAVAQELLGLRSSGQALATRKLGRSRAAWSKQAALSAVFRRALHPTPSARYATAHNFVSALARALSV